MSSSAPIWAAIRPLAFDAYADELYAEYAAATGNKVRFEIVIVEQGELAEIAGKNFGELLMAPEHRVRAGLFGTQILEPRFVVGAVDQDDVDRRDLGYSAQHFADLDIPIRDGAYRKLRISVEIGGERKKHEALELCWPELYRCVVVDPVVVHAKSMVDNRLRLVTEGWGPKLEVKRAEPTEDAAGVCRLASYPSLSSIVYRWQRWSAVYKDALGTVLVDKQMGAQEAGVRCVGTSAETCRASPLGSSLPSSCEAKDDAYTCACSEVFHSRATGAEAKAIAETRCGHSASQPATATIDERMHWQVTGQVDGNVGKLADTCVWTPAQDSVAAASPQQNQS